MKAIDAVLGQPWAIQPEWLSFIAAVAQRQFDAPAATAMRENPARQAEGGLTVRDGVAVIGITGPIFPRANMLTQMSGATSLAQVQAQFRAALADSSVKSIVFNVDSPGGVSTGVGDFAAEVKTASRVKPVVAVATGQVCSAAYWIASAASRLVVSPTAIVGSIGVVVAMSKQVAPDQNGEITVEIVSSNAPDKRADPTDSAGRASILSLLDGLESEFIGAVATNRGVSVDKVKSDFGKGGVFAGHAAVARGMADAVGTLDSVLTGLAAASPVVSFTPRAAAAASSENSMTNPTSVAELTAAFPDLVAGIRADALSSASSTATSVALAAARVEGATAERERILGIEKMNLKGHEDLIAGFKADGKTTPAEAAVAILQAEKAKGGAVLANLASDGNQGPAPAALAQPPAAAKSAETIMADKSRPIEERCKEAFDADESVRSEFKTLTRFTAYHRALENGQIRIVGARR